LIGFHIETHLDEELDGDTVGRKTTDTGKAPVTLAGIGVRRGLDRSGFEGWLRGRAGLRLRESERRGEKRDGEKRG